MFGTDTYTVGCLPFDKEKVACGDKNKHVSPEKHRKWRSYNNWREERRDGVWAVIECRNISDPTEP